jgi:hypothetical protein
MQLISRLALNLLWIAGVAFILAASAASAQTYPPAVGSLTATANDTTPAPGSTVEVSGVVLDANSNPVAGATVTFTVTSNPGGASFDNGQQSITATTNADGVAVALLNTGSEPGTIVVRVDASGVISQVSLTTGAPQALPKTGGPQATSGTTLPLAGAIAAGVGILLLAVGVVTVRKLRVVGS